MNRSMLAGVLGVLVVAFATSAWAAGVPWKNDAAADNKQAEGATGDLKTDMPAALYDRTIKPVDIQVDKALKCLELHAKEMEKPEEKRNAARLVGLKEQASQFYLAASLAAKKAQGMVSDEGQKAAIKTQYEEANRQKAIDILLELAGDAYEKKDFRSAVALYKRILSIDNENAQAKEALTRIAKELQDAQARAGKGSKGGGSDDPRSWERDDASRTGRNQGDWSSTGRGSW